MLRVGLTGGIASGKTTVSDALRRLGAVVIDADVLAREVVEPGTPGLAAVVDRFGAGVLTEDGRLNRDAVGRLVFSDPAARRDLEAIIHPAVRIRAAEIERSTDREAVVVHVIPLLVETGQHDSFDALVVVDADPVRQLERLQRRNGLDPVEAQARLDAQVARADRLRVADVVLDNDGTAADLARQVDALWSDLRRRATAG